MRALITGGAGFIGSHLCDALLDEKFEVTCVDNFVTGSVDNILHNRDKLNLVCASVVNMSSVKFKNGLDWIFHLASPTAPAAVARNKDLTIKSNTNGTLEALRLSEKYNAKLLFTSTIKVNGKCGDEYVESKRQGETLCISAGAKVARLANVYGPRMSLRDSRVVPTFIRKALVDDPISIWNGGCQLDSFCYVSDIVKAIVSFMKSDCKGVVEFGSPEIVSISELAASIISLTNSGSVIENKLAQVCMDSKLPNLELATTILDWYPTVALEAGLEATIADFKGR